MLRPGLKKFKKEALCLFVLLLVFYLLYGLLFFKVKETEAQAVVSAPGVEIPTTAGLVDQYLAHAEGTTVTLTTKILDELKAVFFKNIVGNLTKLLAEQTAIWVASGGKGGTAQFTTNLETALNDFADAAIGDFVSTVLQDLTGINVCTLDPRLAINLTLQIPTFPGWKGYKPKCTFTQLQSHWEEIGKSQLFSFNLTIKPGGQFSQDVSALSSGIENDSYLRLWDIVLLNSGLISCPYSGSVRVICESPQIQLKLYGYAKELTIETNDLNDDIETMIASAVSNQPVPLTVGTYVIAPENINLIKSAWEARINKQNDQLNSLIDFYNGCSNKSALELSGTQCSSILSDLGITPITASIPNFEDVSRRYASDVNSKSAYAKNIAGSIKSGYDYLKAQVDQKLNPDFFEGGAKYDWQLAKDVFNPEASEFNAYGKMVKEIEKVGLNAYINKQLQTTVDQGWKSIESTISKTVRAPATLVRGHAEKLVTKSDIAKAYTKSLAADALGVFMETLWNQLVQNNLPLLLGTGSAQDSKKLIEQKLAEQTLTGLTSAAQPAGLALPTLTMPTLPIFNQFNPYEQQVITPEGIKSTIEQITQGFKFNYSFKDIDLFADFQINIKGQINPNIYNNVIDPNFALALNNKLTIKQAMAQGKITGDMKFSWGDKAEAGTLNLANIKKLRKARVMPLGLELAAELIRDCNYRKNLTNNTGATPYAEFQDITPGYPFGYDYPSAEPYKTQRLRNCLFKPFSTGEDLDAIKQYNASKLDEVINATLGDVVNGFDKIGTGTCGDFDDNESPFCNLVNPEWMLKLPVTKCALETDTEPYGEILQSNQTGQRYSRCPDFVSCLQEDGQGGCINENFGFCVKEKNVWQFATNTCPADFNSCRTYTLNSAQGTTSVSYLKNTLSGSGICGPDNAGCLWYETKSSAGDVWHDYSSFLNQNACQDAGGTWLENRCQPERIYLNHNAEICDQKNEGCNEFFLFRDTGNNLVSDSSFEYTEEGFFPVDWDLRLKQEVGSDKEITNETDCKAVNGSYYETCLNYNYDTQALCSINNGQWIGLCSDGTSTTQTACQTNGGTWSLSCQGAINNDVSETDCANNSGQYKKYCLTSILKYNLCENPQFTGSNAETSCTDNGGTWKKECQISPAPAIPIDSQTVCEQNGGSWREYCQGALLYNSNQSDCKNLAGIWKGYGPFSDRASVSKDGSDVYRGLSKLQIDLGNLPADKELQLLYRSKYNDDTKILTKPGDIYTALAYLKSNQPLALPIIFNIIKTNLGGQNEVNSRNFSPTSSYAEAFSSLVTAQPGTELQILINLPGGQAPGTKVYLDAVDLYLNSIDQVRSSNFLSPYKDYESNNKYYYKKPPERLACQGYGPGDPPPTENFSNKLSCESSGYFWDQPIGTQPAVFVPDKTACYEYKPDQPGCTNYMKVCQPEEVGCQVYTPANGDPNIPGVVSATDYCPAECVGYNAYKQDPVLYEPSPDPLYSYFIPKTASACTLDEVGCSQFTNLDVVAKGGEGIEYYTYLQQCIKPNLGLGEKTFFTWQGSASGAPQLIKYEWQKDSSGAPKTIDNSGDCRSTLGESDFNCLKLYDSDGNVYYRDVRKTISVSEDCHPYRKTDSTQENCQATNGRWQSDINACLYDAIPSEGFACSAQANGCRTFVGNRGNNVYVQLFDNFESSTPLDWYVNKEATDSGKLTRVGESVIVGGHSLYVPAQSVNAIYKPIGIQKGSLYTLSFWAKTDDSAGAVIDAKFSTAPVDKDPSKAFATLVNQKIKLTTNWKNYELGPVFVDWADVSNNQLVFAGITKNIYLDNILLKVVKDNVYVVKNSWNTPASCDTNFYGGAEKGAMLGCQSYKDTQNQTNYLKSFTSLCRTNAVGCQILIDTKNSLNPHSQLFNGENETYLDDYLSPKDELVTLVLNDNYRCQEADKGCQKLGKPNFGQPLTFDTVYFKNNPDKYVNVPQAIMCNEEALGCSELTNEAGGTEYYKIEPTKLCSFTEGTRVNGQSISGWVKKGNNSLGCGSLPHENQNDCEDNFGGWSDTYGQCSVILNEISDQKSCLAKNGEWQADKSRCLAFPFTIYKVFEANKYKGYTGECDSQWNGCTEFVDINPNFVFNGSFEQIDPTGRLLNWSSINSNAGRQIIENNDFKLDAKSVKLIKNTAQEDVNTQNYGIVQTISRLEKGKTYKVSFYYKMPADARGVGSNCPLPEAAFEFNSLDPKLGPNQQGQKYTYTAENDWKKVEVLFTVPSGTDFGDLQNFELILYAPLLGNCLDSYLLYDQVEVKDNTEDSYFVIDSGNNLDRSTCTAVNWEAGCVQFLNTANNSNDIIKVTKDRNCSEWAVCSQTDSKGNCIKSDLCTEVSAGKCVNLAAKKDNVRYDLNSEPIAVKRINNFTTKEGYIYRFGSGHLSALSEWRAGDYSGYTIPDRLPIETELDQNFADQYSRVNDIAGTIDKRYNEPICKIFPAEDSPLPYELSLKPNYKNLLSFYSLSSSLDNLGNTCFYEKADAAGASTYFPPLFVSSGIASKICTAPPEAKGKICTGVTDCIGASTGAEGTCTKIDKVKAFNGLEGMCLEFDTLNPIYDGVYNNIIPGFNNYQPYACLTYFPFAIDTCPLHMVEVECNYNPDCQWDTNNKCVHE